MVESTIWGLQGSWGGEENGVMEMLTVWLSDRRKGKWFSSNSDKTWQVSTGVVPVSETVKSGEIWWLFKTWWLIDTWGGGD